MKNKRYLLIEFFILFILLPLSLITSMPKGVKIGMVVIGYLYVLYVMLRKKKKFFIYKSNLNWKQFWSRILFTFILISVSTIAYVYFIDSNALFCMPINKPLFWIAILFVYTFFSVWPQEIVYRTFYFSRYEKLFLNKNLLIFVNAVVFSLAHLFFRNALVLFLTVIGGFLFAYTYYKTRSTLLVSIEHALYGNWLFTVGMGEMLAFPGMESC